MVLLIVFKLSNKYTTFTCKKTEKAIVKKPEKRQIVSKETGSFDFLSEYSIMPKIINVGNNDNNKINTKPFINPPNQQQQLNQHCNTSPSIY